jgi:purine-nucleoside phosphorylase
MENMQHKIRETATFLNSNGFDAAQAAVVLGTGLGEFLQYFKESHFIAYADIPNFPQATVEFHKGRLVTGLLHGKKIIVMQGRFHYYEGYSMQEVTFAVRVFKELGIQVLLLSNAAGGMHKKHKKGDLVLLEDHINMLPENPLRGLNDPAFGNRFVDMFSPYNKDLNKALLSAAKKVKTPLQKGVYVAVQGPNLETKAEYKYLKAAGADMVGMSTVPEVIVANHIGLPCAAISVITDECQPGNLKPVDISEIISVAAEADKKLCAVFNQFFKEWLS